jgi:hypothetical protein
MDQVVTKNHQRLEHQPGPRGGSGPGGNERSSALEIFWFQVHLTHENILNEYPCDLLTGKFNIHAKFFKNKYLFNILKINSF